MRRAAGFLNPFIDAELARLQPAGGRLRADGLQPGRDDRAVHRPAPRPAAARHPGVFRRADRPGQPGRRADRPPARPAGAWRGRRGRCRSSRSREAEAALRAAGVPVEATYVPRLGHGIDDTGISMGALTLAAGLFRGMTAA